MIGIGIGELILILAITVVCALPFLALAAMLVLTVVDTVRGKGRWGINPGPAICPQCKTPAPTFRRPSSFRQAMWGGWTCASCNLELDKWGKPVAER